MQTLESLRGSIKSAEDLQSVVKTMKAIAAVNIRHAEEAVKSLFDYNRAVELGLQVALRDRLPSLAVPAPAPADRVGAIVFGSDQGMVGQFNRYITAHALSELEQLDIGQRDRRVLAVGLRVAASLEQAGQPIDELLTAPGSTGHITTSVQEALLVIEEWRRDPGIELIYLFYNQPGPANTYMSHSLRLLPVDAAWLQHLGAVEWPTRTLPTFSMEWDELFVALMSEYLFVSLFAAFARSMASENASRLAAMQAAERNIEERLDLLTAQYHQFRQNAITAEILDIVSGFEALTGEAS